MNAENAIEVREVKKHFKIYKDKGHMLRERIIHFSRNKYENREVLKGISFDVKKGESVGLIGRNGCGKSTTLKLLTKILRPNSGTIETNGRVCSLIELGAGFHPDMTGRENVYINASIFGIKAKEVDQRMSDIIRFSELEEFIDNPVRTYSSGMYMRLAFSVAINVDADILLIDEILAVGDSSFQTKCFNKLKSLKDSGTTIVIVSHSLGQVEKLCDKAIWIDEGMIREEGPARLVCKNYLEKMEESRLERAELEYRMQMQEEENRKEAEKKRKEAEIKRQEEQKKQEAEDRIRREKEKEEQKEKKAIAEKRNASCLLLSSLCSADAHRSGSGEVEFTHIDLHGENGKSKKVFKRGERFVVEIDYEAREKGIPVNFVIGITREDWIYCYGTSLQHQDGNLLITNQRGHLSISIDSLALLAGNYKLEVRIQNENREIYDYLADFINICVEDDDKKEAGIFTMPYHWHTEDTLQYVGKPGKTE